ncbi:MAG: hypothetical protein K5694_04995 [Bacilli bacterium]|nr:hypothetical protein [Bacilli bacterium]
MFCKAIVSKRKEHFDKDEYKRLRGLIKPMYKDLKRYIKANGHFNLVEVYDNDGDIVIIRV